MLKCITIVIIEKQNDCLGQWHKQAFALMWHFEYKRTSIIRVLKDSEKPFVL